MSHPCILYVNIVVVVNNNNNNDDNDDDDDDDDDNFRISYPGCLSTRRRHLQIPMKDHGLSILSTGTDGW